MDGNTKSTMKSASSDPNCVKNFQMGPKGYLVPTLSSLSKSSGVREVSVMVNSSATTTSNDYLHGPSLPKENSSSSSAAHLKKSPTAAVEKNKRSRLSVVNTSVKASGRAKELVSEQLSKKHSEQLSKKQVLQRSYVLTSEQLSSGPPLNTGSQMDRNPSDTGSQRLDNRHKCVVLNRNPSDIESQRLDDPFKNVVLNKCTRTSVAGPRVESRNNDFLQQPTGGEVLHSKMKRSCVCNDGPVFSRSACNGEPKQSIHYKPSMESTLQASDSTRGFRLSNNEENRAADFNPIFKGKASRTPRSVSITENGRQWHSGREKMDNVVPSKPFQNDRCGSDKTGRKSGSPLKKQSDNSFNEDLLIPANLACSSSFEAPSNPLLKANDELFAPVAPDKKSYLSEQDCHQIKRMGISDSISGRRSERTKNIEFEHLQTHELTSNSPLHIRLLSAIIEEQVETEESEGTDLDSQVDEAISEYREIPFNEKLKVELDILGLFSEEVSSRDNNDDGYSGQQIAQPQGRLHETVNIKKTGFDQIIEVQNIARDSLEKVVDKLSEVAHNKLEATEGSTSKTGTPRVPKQATASFTERTLARCHKFEESDVSCFSEHPLREIVYAAPTNGSSADAVEAPIQEFVTVVGNAVEAQIHPPVTIVDKNVVQPPIPQSVTATDKNVAVANRGRKREALLGDILDSGVQRKKRSERERKKNFNNKGDSRTKLKNKKAAQPSKLPNATDAPKESTELAKLPVNNIHSVEELGAVPEINAEKEFDDLINIDMVGLDFDGFGLDIPDDNLNDIFLCTTT